MEQRAVEQIKNLIMKMKKAAEADVFYRMADTKHPALAIENAVQDDIPYDPEEVGALAGYPDAAIDALLEFKRRAINPKYASKATWDDVINLLKLEHYYGAHKAANA